MKNKTLIIVTFFLLLLSACSKDSTTNYNPNTTGVAGSLSRFTIVNNLMFCLDGPTLKTFNIANATSPSPVSNITLNTIPDNIFSYENYLLMGTSSGMLIYTVAETPVYISQYEHIVSCDPVVAENGYAYVTLRSVNECSQNIGVNRLEIISLQNISSPQQTAQYDLPAPFGLGVDGSTLFVTSNDSAIAVIDVTDKFIPVFLSSISAAGARDVIPLSGLLLIMAEKKLLQYDYSNLNNIQLISQLDL